MTEHRDTAVVELGISAGKNQDNLRLVTELQEARINFVSELPERPTSDGWSRVLWTERTQLTEATARLRAREAFKNNKDMLDFLDRQSKQTDFESLCAASEKEMERVESLGASEPGQ